MTQRGVALDKENEITEEDLKIFNEIWLEDIRKYELLEEQIKEERKKVLTTEELIKMNQDAIEWAKSIGANVVYVEEPIDMKVITNENINEIQEVNKEKNEKENNQD